MTSQALADITSSRPRHTSWHGLEPRASNAPPLVWYEGAGDEALGLSVSNILATAAGWFEEAPSSTPSEVGDRTDSFSHAMERDFVRLVGQIPEVERIFIRKDVDYMRIWTVIHEVDVEVEDRIYDAQLAFMDKFPEIPCDFSVIFRQDLDPSALNPFKAQILFRR